MNHYDGEILVDRIRSICKKKNISIAQMEKELKWSQGLISRWSKNSPSIGKIMEVVRYLGVSYEELLGEINSDEEEEDEQETLSHKLYRVTEIGELTWELCDKEFKNLDVQDLLNSNDETDCKIYSSSYENGYFLLIVNREGKGYLEIAVLHSIKGRIVYQDQEPEEWLENLLNLIDQDEYEEWNNMRTKYYIRQFMVTDFR